jgi:hypothetical protein
MKLSEPKVITFIIAVVIGLLALLSTFVAIPFVSANAFWVLFVGFLLLALANLFKGL